jgi:Sugar-transfer associated ATP-grasp
MVCDYGVGSLEMLRKAAMIVAAALDGPVRKLDRIARLLAEELNSQAPLPLWQRLRGLRHGFGSVSMQLYRMTLQNRHLYVSDYQRIVLTPDINGPYRVMLKDKLLFNLMTQIFPDLHIPAHGIVDRGRLMYPRHRDANDPVRYVANLLDDQGRLVLKPLVGGGGAKIFFLARDSGAFFVNERRMSEAEFSAWFLGRQQNLINDFVLQCPELAALYPRTTNTVRLLTMWDFATMQPFIAGAVLRIGNAASYPVDNTMAGGFAAAVDLASGRASKAVSLPIRSKPVTWLGTHPDSGARIEGIVIPHWERIAATILEVCRHLPYLPYVGWDVIVTADGFKLVEGNHFPGLFPHQAHAPLLADPRVLRFFQAYGIV